MQVLFIKKFFSDVFFNAILQDVFLSILEFSVVKLQPDVDDSGTSESAIEVIMCNSVYNGAPFNGNRKVI